MKRPLAATLIVLFVMAGTPASWTMSRRLDSPRPPQSASVTVRLLKAPGLNLPGSKWEIAYEFRILPESSLFKERAKLNDNSTERAGDLIKKATLVRSLAASSGQTMLFEIPFSAPILEKLKNQPKDRLAPGEDARSQIFVFYSVINVRDAKLGKTLTIPVTWVWDFANYPAARFQVDIEINDDEKINVRSSSLKTRPMTIQRRTK